MGNGVTQAVVVTDQTAVRPLQGLEQLALFNSDGSPYTGSPAATTSVAGVVKKMPAQADTVAVDLAALKVDFNALLAKLRTAGILS